MKDGTKSNIDIILPTFNRCYVLWRAITSILTQDYPYFRLIIVDDGSTDDTKKLIKQFIDPRLTFISKTHKGVSAARNSGIKIGKSPYIAYLDSDNIWQSNYLSSMIAALEANKNAVFAYCGLNYMSQEMSPDYDKEVVVESTGMPVNELTMENLWNKMIYLDTNQIIHKRNIVKKIGLWDEKLPILTDWDFVIRAYYMFPERFISVKKTLVTYIRQVGCSDSISANNNLTNAHKIIYEKYKKIFKTKPSWVNS